MTRADGHARSSLGQLYMLDTSRKTASLQGEPLRGCEGAGAPRNGLRERISARQTVLKGLSNVRAAPGGLTLLLVAFLACTCTAACGAPEASDAGPSSAALVVRGVERYQAGAVAEGISDLYAAVGACPEWGTAREALAAALLGAGRADEALREYSVLVGENRAQVLAAGELSAADLGTDVRPSAIFGLAHAHESLGHGREADRLYRLYSDLVGPTSESAAVAYYRISNMFRHDDLAWGDPDAEMAKALAIVPDIETRLLSPSLPEAAAVPELAPFVSQIEPVSGEPGAYAALDSLPALLSWTRPTYRVAQEEGTGERRVVLEILVGADGLVRDVRAAEETGEECDALIAGAVAATRWRFAPAVANAERTEAWIAFEAAVYAEFAPAPNDTARAGAADTLGGERSGAPADAAGATAADSVGTRAPDAERGRPPEADGNDEDP